jgi:ABC-type sugar transport system permease subunit
MENEPSIAYSLGPVNKSWTATKVVAIIVAIVSGLYMLPWAIAALRDVKHWGVFWVNLLLGWTIIGWVIALVMALRSQDRVVVVVKSSSNTP